MYNLYMYYNYSWLLVGVVLSPWLTNPFAVSQPSPPAPDAPPLLS